MLLYISTASVILSISWWAKTKLPVPMLGSFNTIIPHCHREKSGLFFPSKSRGGFDKNACLLLHQDEYFTSSKSSLLVPVKIRKILNMQCHIIGMSVFQVVWGQTHEIDHTLDSLVVSRMTGGW